MKNRSHLSSLGAVVAAAEAVAAVVAVHRITTSTSVPVYSVLIPSTFVATILVYLESPAFTVGEKDSNNEITRVAAITELKSDQHKLMKMIGRTLSNTERPNPTPEIPENPFHSVSEISGISGVGFGRSVLDSVRPIIFINLC